MTIRSLLLFATLLLGVSSAAFTQSVISARVDDPKAVYLTSAELGVRGDGKADDSAALQSAIDKAESHVREGIVFVPSGRYRLTRTIYLDNYGLITAAPGHRIYASSESEDITYSGLVGPDGALSDLKPFVQRGGQSVAVHRSGNVYVANGQIFVYNPAGKQIAQIDVPERPIDIVLGGSDGRTLYILAHHSLFAVQVRGSE